MYNAAFAAKWLKVYVNLQLLHLFLHNHLFFFTAFTAFATEWPP